MAMRATERFIDSLPAVFRRDEVAGENFLGRFLRAFEAVFNDIQEELDAIPGLFALAPTPSLAVKAEAGTSTLRLDSAAGLCPGDILQILDPNRVEFVEVQSVPPDLVPTTLTLKQSINMRHRQAAGISIHPNSLKWHSKSQVYSSIITTYTMGWDMRISPLDASRILDLPFR